MVRHWIVAAAVLAALPVSAQAQLPGRDEGYGPRVRATPFVGFSPGITSKGTARVLSATSPTAIDEQFEFSLGSGPVSGVNLELRFYNRFSVIASGAWSSRDASTFQTLEGFEDEYPGSDLWLAKLAAGVRLREAQPDLQMRGLNAMVFIGPALVREVPEISLLKDTQFTSAANNWGVNIGAEGELPLAKDFLAFTIGLEDNIIFWDEAGQATRLQPLWRPGYGDGAVAEIDSDHSHFWVARIGLSFRFGR